MYSPMLFAETTTHTTLDAAAIAKELGPGWFFIALCIVVVASFVVGLGWIFYKFGNRLFDRLDTFLNCLQESTTTNATAMKDHAAVAQAMRVMHTTLGGPCNVADLRDAGHSFANAMEKIGKEIGADISDDCSKIHEKLKTVTVIM